MPSEIIMRVSNLIAVLLCSNRYLLLVVILICHHSIVRKTLLYCSSLLIILICDRCNSFWINYILDFSIFRVCKLPYCSVSFFYLCEPVIIIGIRNTPARLIGNRCHKSNSYFPKFIEDTFFKILKCQSVSVLGTYMCNTALASNDIVCKRYIIAVEISKCYKISPVIKSLICSVILSDNIAACEFFKKSLFALSFEIKVFVIYIINLFILAFTSVRLFYLYYSVFFHNALFKSMLPAFPEASALFVHCVIESCK